PPGSRAATRLVQIKLTDEQPTFLRLGSDGHVTDHPLPVTNDEVLITLCELCTHGRHALESLQHVVDLCLADDRHVVIGPNLPRQGRKRLQVLLDHRSYLDRSHGDIPIERQPRKELCELQELAAPGVARWARVHAPAAQLNGHDDGDRRVELPHCVPPAAVKPTRRTAGALMGRNHPMTTFPGIQVHNDTAGTTKLLACRR